MEKFNYSVLNREDYNGLDGALISPHKVKTKGYFNVGDVLTPLVEFNSDIQLHCSSKGFTICSAYMNYYITNETLSKLTFEVKN